jgi:hypothetical protein
VEEKSAGEESQPGGVPGQELSHAGVVGVAKQKYFFLPKKATRVAPAATKGSFTYWLNGKKYIQHRNGDRELYYRR